MERPTKPARLRIQLNKRSVLALLAAEALILSVLHHRYNFWGWSAEKQALIILIVAPVAAYILDRLLEPVWPEISRIPRRRWLLFLLPAAVIAALPAWTLLTFPEIPHLLEIVASPQDGAGQVQVQEIRAAYGNIVPLPKLANTPGWTLQDGTLVADGAGSEPLRYSFVGPIDEQLRVTFLVSPQAGLVRVRLDGQELTMDLAGQAGQQARARPTTQYAWGFLNFLIMPLTLAADLSAFMVLLAALWIAQELNNSESVSARAATGERFLSHAQGLAIACAVALVLHTISFLAVPLYVLKDSPSYLQGAVYWIQHHSLDGVSSYRGPGTTLFFAPALTLFGRNPWGVKLALHLLTAGCVPLSYRLGWQTGRRRWFAFSTALLTALIPDLYAYSSLVLSEAPHLFSVLLYCTLLISALERPTLGWILAALLAGSFSILVRSENVAAFVIGLGFIFLRLLLQRKPDQTPSATGADSPLRARSMLVALSIAALPLLVWSLHNQKVYGFFGLSDYGGAALYDGWIYFGESSHIAIADKDSSAVQGIDAALSSDGISSTEVPTSWTIYYALMNRGYTSEQAFTTLQRATVESIRKNIPSAWKVLLVKLRQGFEPQPYIPATFPLPGENSPSLILNADYFDSEPVVSPQFVGLQRSANELIGRWYGAVFSVWFWLGLVFLFISLYRRPFFTWVPLAALGLAAIAVPTVVGMSMWRYVLLGLVLLQYPPLAGIQSIGRFISQYAQRVRSSRPPLNPPAPS